MAGSRPALQPAAGRGDCDRPGSAITGDGAPHEPAFFETVDLVREATLLETHPLGELVQPSRRGRELREDDVVLVCEADVVEQPAVEAVGQLKVDELHLPPEFQRVVLHADSVLR